MEAIGIIKLIN